MAVISIKKCKKNKGMYSVFIDDRYAFSITEEDYYRHCLYEDREISDEQIESIKQGASYKDAKSQAIRHLSYRMLSESQLFSKLQTKGYNENIIWDVINELKSIGYLNDMMYAKKFVYERMKLKPKSKRMLKIELAGKGVPDDIITQVIDEMDFDEDMIIEGLIKRRFGKYNIQDPKIKKKIYYFLLHRGFSIGNIRGVLKRITDPI